MEFDTVLSLYYCNVVKSTMELLYFFNDGGENRQNVTMQLPLVHVCFTMGCDHVIRNVHNRATKRAQTQLWRVHTTYLSADGRRLSGVGMQKKAMDGLIASF